MMREKKVVLSLALTFDTLPRGLCQSADKINYRIDITLRLFQSEKKKEKKKERESLFTFHSYVISQLHLDS
jgi:hypothetical protein